MTALSYEVIFFALAAGLLVSLVSFSGWFVICLSAQRLHSLVPNLVALTVLLGVLFTLLVSQIAQSSLTLLLPIAAGGFIYIAASDLIPVLHERSSLMQLSSQSLAFALGIGFMKFIVLFEQALLVA